MHRAPLELPFHTTYDYQKRRVRKTVGGQPLDYVYNGINVVGEAAGGQLVASYDFGADLVRATFAGEPGSRWHGHGALGSTTALVGDAAALVARYEYGAWGEIISAQQPTLNKVGFTGYRLDDETRLNYAVNRYYDSETGRFTSADPLTEINRGGRLKNPQGLNLYPYVASRPTKYVDPDGLEWVRSQGNDLAWNPHPQSPPGYSPVATGDTYPVYPDSKIGDPQLEQFRGKIIRLDKPELGNSAQAWTVIGEVSPPPPPSTTEVPTDGAAEAEIVLEGFTIDPGQADQGYTWSVFFQRTWEGTRFGAGFSGLGAGARQFGEEVLVLPEQLYGQSKLEAEWNRKDPIGFANWKLKQGVTHAFGLQFHDTFADTAEFYLNNPNLERDLVSLGEEGLTQAVGYAGTAVAAGAITDNAANSIIKPPGLTTLFPDGVPGGGPKLLGPAGDAGGFNLGGGGQMLIGPPIGGSGGAASGGGGTVRVGRWMHPDELNAMQKTGFVQESRGNGITNVAHPADPNAYFGPAPLGDVYVEFDIPAGLPNFRPKGGTWASIFGPSSILGRLAKQKGLPLPQMPPATNIAPKMTKISN